jgi:fucose permease
MNRNRCCEKDILRKPCENQRLTMQNWQIKASLFLNYFVFAILLNSVGTVILQVQNNYGVSEGAASVLEAFKDLSIAAVSFMLSSYIARIGYKNAMLLALGLVTAICFLMPSLSGFWATKLLFAAIGTSFALIKMSVYSTIGLVTRDEKEHISLMNFIESFFMIGVLTGYFIFSAFVDDSNPQSIAWLKVYYRSCCFSPLGSTNRQPKTHRKSKISHRCFDSWRCRWCSCLCCALFSMCLWNRAL